MLNDQYIVVPIVIALVSLNLLFSSHAWPQRLPISQDRPADIRPQLPPYSPSTTGKSNILPSILLPKTPDTQGLAAGQRVYVKRYNIIGNNVLSNEELTTLAEPYLNRETTFAELGAFRDTLTRAYIDQGYVNSGAVIPPQSVENGIVEIQIIEGRLTDIAYETDGRFRESYIDRRIRKDSTDPLNIYRLEQNLQLLQQDDRIQYIQAAVVPTDERGESRLRLKLVENNPVRVFLQLDNYETPSVGAEAGRFRVSHNNLTGFGDRLEAGYSRTKGLWSVNGRYEWPLLTNNTLFDVHANHSESNVVEDPFDNLDIESRSSTYGFTLRHTIKASLASTTQLFFTSEYRSSKSFLLGQPFSFSPGVEDGKSKVAVSRLGYEWSHRSQRQVFTVSSMLSVGLGILGATKNTDDLPDSQFVSALLQAQWARRLRFWDAQIIARGDAQLSDSPLLGLEQFSIGGHATVRGYRENTLVRDQGWVASIELRVPIFHRLGNKMALALGVFADIGRAWNKNSVPDQPERLTSVGISSHWTLNDNINIQVDWAEQLKNVPNNQEYDLQNDGVHVRLSAMY